MSKPYLTDPLLYAALVAHKAVDSANSIEPNVMAAWDVLKQQDAKYLSNAAIMGDGTAQCLIGAICLYGGPESSLLLGSPDRIAIQSIAGRALQRYRELTKSATDKRIRTEIHNTHSNFGDLNIQ